MYIHTPENLAQDWPWTHFSTQFNTLCFHHKCAEQLWYPYLGLRCGTKMRTRFMALGLLNLSQFLHIVYNVSDLTIVLSAALLYNDIPWWELTKQAVQNIRGPTTGLSPTQVIVGGRVVSVRLKTGLDGQLASFGTLTLLLGHLTCKNRPKNDL